MRAIQHHWSGVDGWQPAVAPQADPSVQLVLLFGAASVAEQQECLGPLRAGYPKAVVFGCTTAGEIHGSTLSHHSAVATAVSFGKTAVKAAMVDVAAPDHAFKAGVELVRCFEPAGLRHLFVLSDGIVVNGADLLEGINAALPPGVGTSGGCAAVEDDLGKTHVWCDSRPLSSTVVALGFYGDRLRVGTCATGGWGPFGMDRMVTRSHKNVLYELDGQPALALYKKYLGEHAARLPAAGLMFPVELRDSRGGSRVLRAVETIDEGEQSITFAGNVPQGFFGRFMVGDIEDLIQGTQQAAEGSLRGLPSGLTDLSLVVSCKARRAVLKQRVAEEIQTVRETVGPGPVLCGFYSHGEIAPAGGCASEFHNETMCITSLAEE